MQFTVVVMYLKNKITAVKVLFSFYHCNSSLHSLYFIYRLRERPLIVKWMERKRTRILPMIPLWTCLMPANQLTRRKKRRKSERLRQTKTRTRSKCPTFQYPHFFFNPFYLSWSVSFKYLRTLITVSLDGFWIQYLCYEKAGNCLLIRFLFFFFWYHLLDGMWNFERVRWCW